MAAVQGLMSRALASQDPPMVESTLVTMHAQLQSVAVVAAALRHLREASPPASAGGCAVAPDAHARSKPVPHGSDSGQAAVEGAATGALALEEVEALLSRHVRAHCPEPLVLHSLFPQLVQAAFGSSEQPPPMDQNGASGGGSGGNNNKRNNRKKKAKAEEGRKPETGQHEPEVELMVNVEGMVEEGQGEGRAGTHGWGQQEAIAAAELLLRVRCL